MRPPCVGHVSSVQQEVDGRNSEMSCPIKRGAANDPLPVNDIEVRHHARCRNILAHGRGTTFMLHFHTAPIMCPLQSISIGLIAPVPLWPSM